MTSGWKGGVGGCASVGGNGLWVARNRVETHAGGQKCVLVAGNGVLVGGNGVLVSGNVCFRQTRRVLPDECCWVGRHRSKGMRQLAVGIPELRLV